MTNRMITNRLRFATGFHSYAAVKAAALEDHAAMTTNQYLAEQFRLRAELFRSLADTWCRAAHITDWRREAIEGHLWCAFAALDVQDMDLFHVRLWYATSLCV